MFPVGPTPDPGRSRWINLMSMLAVALLTLLVYNRALDFGFFNDDPTGHFAWMETRGYADYFRSSADYGYYRPVVFVILQGLVDTFGYNPVSFHALLLGLHGANTALLWLLVWQLSSSRPYAWAAALLFATFPFSYEAVTYVASLTHPLLLFWLLLTLLLYRQAQKTAGRSLRRYILYAAAMLTMLLGLLTHENGLFIPLALAGVEWLQKPPTGVIEGVKRPFLPYLAVLPLFILLWWTIPKSSEQTLSTLSAWASNLIPFLQSLAYPLLPLFQLTADQTGALVALALVTLAASYLAARLARATGLWLFALSWFLLSSLPATLFLSPDYLYGSPRLHYLPSVGVAMLWAMPVLSLARRLPAGAWGRAGTVAFSAVYALAIALPALAFVNCEMDFYSEATRIVRGMAALGKASPAEQDLLFANVPLFFSSYSQHPNGCRAPYPWTPVGAVVMPSYASARDFVRFNGGPDRPATAVTIAEYGPGWNTHGDPLSPASLREQLPGSAVYVYDLNAGRFFDLSAVWHVDRTGETAPMAVFGDGFSLNSAVVNPVGPDGEIEVALTWQAHDEAGQSIAPVVFVHVYNESGQLVAQHDGPPAAGFVPVAWWQATDVILDSHRVATGGTLAPGIYAIAVGLYDPLSGERLAGRAQDEPLADNLLVVKQLPVP